MKKSSYISKTLILLILCFSLVACSNNKVTRENIGKVVQGVASDDGITLAQVEAILGTGKDLTKREFQEETDGKGLVGVTYKKWSGSTNKLILGFENNYVVGIASTVSDSGTKIHSLERQPVKQD